MKSASFTGVLNLQSINIPFTTMISMIAVARRHRKKSSEFANMLAAPMMLPRPVRTALDEMAGENGSSTPLRAKFHL
jgi:hypothetical protein